MAPRYILCNSALSVFILIPGLAREYANRRDFFVDNLAESFHLRLATARQDFWQGCDVYDAYLKPTSLDEKYGFFGEAPLFSFVAPSSGMFVWVCQDHCLLSSQ
jgi:aromatic amino acid aminotransferase I / 2-aminoadipate transaminase